MRNLFACCCFVLLGLTACKPDDAPRTAVPPTDAPEATAPVAVPAYTQGYVVELAPAQTLADLRAAADDVFVNVVSIEPLFPDVPADDDPEGLSRIHRVRVSEPPQGNPWDSANALRERGGRLGAVGPGGGDDRIERAMREWVSQAARGDGARLASKSAASAVPIRFGLHARRLRSVTPSFLKASRQ